MATGKTRQINKLTTVSFVVSVISCLAALAVVPEIRQFIFDSPSTTDPPANSVSPVIDVAVAGSNDEIRINSGTGSSNQDSYTINSSNSQTTFTLPPHSTVKLRITGANDSIFVSKKIAIGSTVDLGANNKVIQ